MTRKCKPKFHRNQVVWYHRRNEFWVLEKISAVKYFPGEGFGYQFDAYIGGQYHEEEKIHPLSKQEARRD